MKISIIHPSKGRPQMALNTYENWMGKADNPNSIDYILSVDLDGYKDYYIPFKKHLHSIRILTRENRSCIDAINNSVEFCKGGLFVVVSDDFDCPKHWDSLLISMIATLCLNDFCIKTQDGIQKTLITLPILDRTYYNRFGYIYNPEYIHMGCDVEFTAVAIMLGRYYKSLDLLFPHNHYSTGKMVKDETNIRNDQSYQQGDALVKERAKINFGIENPVMLYQDIIWH